MRPEIHIVHADSAVLKILSEELIRIHDKMKDCHDDRWDYWQKERDLMIKQIGASRVTVPKSMMDEGSIKYIP